MRSFFLVTLVYLAFAVAVAGATQGDLPAVFGSAGEAMVTLAGLMTIPVTLVFALAALREVFWPTPNARLRLVDVWLAAASALVLQVAFSVLKTALPGIVPFYADPALASIDAWIHGGINAFELVHVWGQGVSPDYASWAYLHVWSFAAVLFPIVLSLTDDDVARRKRFLTLYLGCWIVLGNLLALAASSVGPVFYDQLVGGARFADLGVALQQSGIAGSQIGAVQSFLLHNYLANLQQPSAAISAFPSMHVAMAALCGLYLAERSRWLAPLGAAFVLVILFLSVFTGYHYAIDGYAAIALVTAAWWAQRANRAVLGARIARAADALISRGAPVALRLPRSLR
ncbi:MAG: phosphatase PAP2 family protein [Rhodobacteraceae bacterium]|nr:phosphatase PAP2 family protein [Paracoccaceae bacterium]